MEPWMEEALWWALGIAVPAALALIPRPVREWLKKNVSLKKRR